MTQRLDEIFGELGLSQYLDGFIDQGFDSWETILDITESDLDVLGVKLGHRRKLQRRIANSRGVAPEAALTSPTQPSIEDPRPDAHRPDAVKGEPPPTLITKRKYRRHPKPDENAPERPPSAYVLFSNKMREDLKDRNLTFTEIAKLVGENWQNLSPVEKEPYETQAQTMKDKYNQDLTAYKRTVEYKKYMVYLQDFKAKHSHQTQDKDMSKRVKLSDPRSTSQNGMANGERTRSGSGSGSQQGSEPPPTREQRLGSFFSASDSQYSSHHALQDDSLHSPPTALTDRRPDNLSPPLSISPRDPPSRLHSSWMDSQRLDSVDYQRSLPPLSDIIDARHAVNGVLGMSETNGYGGFHRSNPTSSGSGSGSAGDSPGPAPGLVGGDSRPPPLRKEYSTCSSVSSFSFPRTPVDTPALPIHALLSGKTMGPLEMTNGQPHSSGSRTPPLSCSQDGPGNENLVNGGSVNSDPMAPSLKLGSGYFSSPPPVASHASRSPPVASGFAVKQTPPLKRPAPSDGEGNNLDGMSALLKAGELVDRLPQ